MPSSKNKKSIMRTLCIRVPPAYIALVDELVRRGRYKTRSDFVREALRKLLREELMLENVIDAIDRAPITVERSTQGVKVIELEG